MIMKKLLVLLVVIGLVGCSAKQGLTTFSDAPKKVCIAKHDAVRHPSFLEGMIDGFKQNNTEVRVIQGFYRLENKIWNPTYLNDEVVGCDQVVFYVANWRWDGVMYLKYANIWINGLGFQSKTVTGQATYEVAGLYELGLTKFVDSKEKATELVNQLYN